MNERVAALMTASKTVMQVQEYDDEDLLLYQAVVVSCFGVKEDLRKEVRIKNFVERVVPSFCANEFKSHFRLSPDSFEFILSQIGRRLQRKRNDGRETIPPKKQLLLALWRFATPDSYRSIIMRFDVAKATAILTVKRVSKELARLAPVYIKWPSTPQDFQKVHDGFYATSAFPKIVGAIDGTHIGIPAPKENPESYVNRKGYHSVQLQAVCNHKAIFLHCFGGYPGCVHDARVLRNSSVFNRLGDDTKFPDDSHLVGDGAYALHPNLLVPFEDNGHLTERQKNFNFCLSSARIAIERAFALLKGRWRCLLEKLAMHRIDLVPEHIMACCVLHNICIMRNDHLHAIAAYPGPRERDQRPHQQLAEAGQRAAGLAKSNLIATRLRMRDA